MTWDFMPTQVMKGEVEYGFDDFRRDLSGQVIHNFGSTMTPEKLKKCCDLFWVFCHLKATMETLDEIKEKLSMGREFAEMMSEICEADGEMLAAIYQNLFLKYFAAALRDSWGDEERATSRALALLNLYIIRHLRNE